MSQIETDIKELRQKYGDKKGIKTADQIMRVVTELENRMYNKPTVGQLEKIIKFVKENP